MRIIDFAKLIAVATLAGPFTHLQAADAPPAGPHSSYLDVDAIVAGWKSTFGSMERMRVSYEGVTVLTEMPSAPLQVPGLPAVNYSAILNAGRRRAVERVEEGARFYARISGSTAGIGTSGTTCHSFDGQVSRDYWEASRSGTVRKGLMGWSVETENALKSLALMDAVSESVTRKEGQPSEKISSPLFVYLLTDPATGRPRADITVLPQMEDVSGHLCHVVTRAVTHGDASYGFRLWIAQNNGMVPMKFRNYIDGISISEMQVLELAKVDLPTGSFWYPRRAKKATWSKTEGKTEEQYEVTEFDPCPELKDDVFRLAFPAGTRVVDRIVGIQYVTGSEVAGPGDKPHPIIVLGSDPNAVTPPSRRPSSSASDKSPVTHGTAVREDSAVPSPAETPWGQYAVLAFLVSALVMCGLALLKRKHHVKGGT